MFQRIARSGAASPVGGMNRLEPQQASENTIIRSANEVGSPPSFAAMPPTIEPSRIAMKVAPFHQRVAGRQLGAGEMVGQDAVFDRAEQRADHPEQEQRDEQDQHRVDGRIR